MFVHEPLVSEVLTCNVPGEFHTTPNRPPGTLFTANRPKARLVETGVASEYEITPLAGTTFSTTNPGVIPWNTKFKALVVNTSVPSVA